jgi:hypothetical protein
MNHRFVQTAGIVEEKAKDWLMSQGFQASELKLVTVKN